MLNGLGLDQVALAGSGSAPIPPELIAWYRRLGLQLLEGYGMTEDFATRTCRPQSTTRRATSACRYPGVEVKLSDEGEVLIKSPGTVHRLLQAAGADGRVLHRRRLLPHRRPRRTPPDGLLKITGRVKELFKTAKGKYVAPAPIENRSTRIR